LLRQRAVRKRGTFSTIADDEWISHMNLKFFSAVRCARELLPYMQRNIALNNDLAPAS
jgi:hypothetical protein